MYAKQKRWPAAVTELKRAFTLGNFDSPVYAELTGALCEAGDLKEAVKCGEEGVKKFGGSKYKPEALALHCNSLGKAYAKTGRNEEALELFHAAQQTLPGESHTDVNIASTLNAMGQRSEARRIWSKLATEGTGSPTAVEAREILAKYPENGK